MIVSQTCLLGRNSKTACDCNCINGREAIRLLNHFIEDSAPPSVAYRVFGADEDDSHQEEKLTNYFHAASVKQATCGTDEIFGTEAEADTTDFTQQEETSAVLYSNSLWKMWLCYGLACK